MAKKVIKKAPVKKTVSKTKKRPQKSRSAIKSKLPIKKEKPIVIPVWPIVAALLGIIFLASIFTHGFTALPFGLGSSDDKQTVISEEKAKQKVLDYINKQLLKGQATAEITEFGLDSDSKDLYKFKMNIQGQDYESFMSKDGKFLYSERMEIKEKTYPKSDTPEALVFTMSYCPYGNIADEFVAPVSKLLNDKVKIEPHYIVNKNTETGEWESLHGKQELNQDVRELCIFKYQKEKFWDFVLAVNKQCTSENVDSCWEKVAQSNGIETNKIKTCQKDEANSLLEKELLLTDQYAVQSSPTIIINGEQYDGARTSADFQKVLCDSFNNKPGECDQAVGTDTTTTTTPSGSCN